MQFFLPVKALSVNQLWQGRRFKTPAYKAYETELSYLIPKGRVEGEVEVTVEFYVKNKQSDLDNVLKALLDVMTKTGLYEDDRYIMALHAHKITDQPAMTPGIRVTITPYS